MYDIDATKYEEPPKILPWIIAGGFFMQMLDGTILNTALPAIAYSMHENPLRMQSIIIVYFLTVAFLLPLSGWLADRFGSKKIFNLAIIIFTMGSLSCAFAQTLNQLIAARIFQAVGGATLVPVGRLIVLKAYPRYRLIELMSFIMLPALIGPLLGPVLGGFLVEYLSWEWIFLINLPIGAICFALSSKYMPDIKEVPYGFDWSGFFLFSTAIVVLCVGLENGYNFGQRPAMIAAAMVMLAGYLVYAAKKKRPVFRLDLLKIPSFLVGGVGSFFSRVGVGGLPYLLPLLLQVGLKISPSNAGLIILTLGISTLVAKSFVERILKFFGYRTFLFFNTIIMGALICSFSLIDATTPIYVIVVVLYIFGTVNSLQFTAMATLALIDLPRHFASEGNSLFSVLVQVAASIGVSIAATILNYFSAAEGNGGVLLNAFQNTYLIIGIFTVFTSVNFLFTPKGAGGLER